MEWKISKKLFSFYLVVIIINFIYIPFALENKLKPDENRMIQRLPSRHPTQNLHLKQFSNTSQSFIEQLYNSKISVSGLELGEQPSHGAPMSLQQFVWTMTPKIPLVTR